MNVDVIIAAWGERQTLAILLVAGSALAGAALVRRTPDAPDMERAGRLPAWRKAVPFIPSSLYLGFETWRQPPLWHGDGMLADLFGAFPFHTPILYVLLVVVGIVAATDLTGGRALKLAMYALGGVFLLIVSLAPVVLGLHVMVEVLTGL